MKLTGSFLGLAMSSLLFAAIALVGCGKGDESTSAANDPAKKPRPAPAAYLEPLKPEQELAMRINRLGRFASHNRPNDRPTVTSAAYPDVIEWKTAALLDGGQRSSLTNQAAFLEASNVFRFYAEFSGGRSEALAGLTEALTKISPDAAKDPLVGFLIIDILQAKTNTAIQSAIALAENTALLQESAHHPLFKHVATRRTSIVARDADRAGDRWMLMVLATHNLEDVAKDRNVPWEELYGSISKWLVYTYSKEWTDFVLSDLEGLLDTGWKSHPGYYELKGQLEIDRGWGARGSGYASTVTEEGFKKFNTHLSKAEEYLMNGWALDTNRIRIARSMMRVELGQGKGLKRQQMWFERVMALDTNNYDACVAMAYYLEPRWYGSEDQSLRFARSCVASTKWGGEVPLVLRAVHSSLAQNQGLLDSETYWHRQQVWSDVRSSYEKFFRLNPGNVERRQEYARDAFRCGKYQVFIDELPKFTAGTNFSFFGGVTNFVSMVSKARERAGK